MEFNIESEFFIIILYNQYMNHPTENNVVPCNAQVNMAHQSNKYELANYGISVYFSLQN